MNINSNPHAVSFPEMRFAWTMLLVVPCCWAIVYFLYINVVDLNWLYGSMIPEYYSGKSELVNSLAGRPLWIHFLQAASPPSFQRWGLMLGVSITFAALCELGSLRIGLVRAFSIALLSFFGNVLAAVLAALRLAFNQSQHLPPQQLDPLSWSALQDLQFASPYFNIGSQISLVLIANVAILALILRRSCNLTWPNVLAYSALPYGLVYGARLYFAAQV